MPIFFLRFCQKFRHLLHFYRYLVVKISPIFKSSSSQGCAEVFWIFKSTYIMHITYPWVSCNILTRSVFMLYFSNFSTEALSARARRYVRTYPTKKHHLISNFKKYYLLELQFCSCLKRLIGYKNLWPL